MKYNSNVLLDSLQADVRQVLFHANQLKQGPFFLLQQQPSTDKWSVAQVLEHLNFYAGFYITAIEEKLHLNRSAVTVYFTPGILGNYFTKLMKPTAQGSISKKMKAPANAIPSEQPDATKVLDEFISHQHHLLNLLQVARSANLGYIRIPTSLSKFIALKLGDTFRFLIAHEQRHFVQINAILKSLNPSAAAVAG